MKRELKIELPNYDGRLEDVNTIEMIAYKYDLDYDVLKAPILTVTDMATEQILLTADHLMRIYISGDVDKIDAFLEDLEKWFTKF